MAQEGLGRIDKILLRGASSHKSPNEIAAMTGNVVKPAEAAARIVEILDSRDWLSEAQKRMLLLDDLMALKDMLYEKAITFKSLDAAKPLGSILTQIDRTISGQKIDIQAALTQISRAQAQIMLQGINIALERSFLELEKRYPQVEKAILLEVFQAAMPEAVKEIESRVSD